MSSPRRRVYRITKYDPADRNERGVYTGVLDSVGDHGPVEAAYLDAVAAFAEDAGVRDLAVREPQVAPGFTHFGLEPAVEGHGLAGLFPPDEEQFAVVAARIAGARAAAALSVYVDERTPLFTAVLPDADGVVRARWRTDPAPGDRGWPAWTAGTAPEDRPAGSTTRDVS
ncbi:hypothetical protein ACWCXH_31100 [Kitasatospora sp. NPDC001660]